MYPTEYEFQKQAILRGLSNDRNFKRIEAGFQGEEKFYKYLKEFGSKHWVILRNQWLKNDSHFECDFILITGHAVYVFEVKNYYGKFVYENGQSYSRGRAITYNPINQARNARLHLQQLLHHYTVKGALVFIGKHNQVCINDEINDIDILETNEVYEFIQSIKREEELHNGRYHNTSDIVQHLQKYRIDPPYHPAPYTRADMEKAKKGIFCANCQQKVAVNRNKYVICPCGLHESKEEAVIRTACEYGVLTYGQSFVVRDIYNFLGQEVSIDYVRILLRGHFKIVPNSKILTFQNLNREISQLSTSFEFELPKMIILK